MCDLVDDKGEVMAYDEGIGSAKEIRRWVGEVVMLRREVEGSIGGLCGCCGCGTIVCASVVLIGDR